MSDKEGLSQGEHERLIRQRRNRELHYQKALIQRLERQSRTRRLYLSALVLPLFSIMTALIISVVEREEFIDKSAVQSDFSILITNGADLDAVKQALLTQPKVGQISTFFSSDQDFYASDIPLSTVLNDVRVNLYRNNDIEILSELDLLINEHEQVNPFDKLQTSQKDYFENIRIKTGDAYIRISNDVNNLADELYQQNILVDEYLTKSELSFWISLSAVLLSLIIGGYQIALSRPAALRKIFINAIEAYSESAESTNKQNQADA